MRKVSHNQIYWNTCLEKEHRKPNQQEVTEKHFKMQDEFEISGRNLNMLTRRMLEDLKEVHLFLKWGEKVRGKNILE